MKPNAYLTQHSARGGIVNEEALFDALAGQRIAGAALDCFVGEPLTKPPLRFAELDNVLLSATLRCLDAGMNCSATSAAPPARG